MKHFICFLRLGGYFGYDTLMQMVNRWHALGLTFLLGATGVAAQSGDYQGVDPEQGEAPSHVLKVKGTSNLLTWPGFKMLRDGRSQFFLQFSSPMNYEERRKDGLIEIELKDVKPRLRNTMRVLDTRYFNTPVRSAKVKRKGKSLVFTLQMRAQRSPQIRAESRDGFHYLLVEFPAGDFQEVK